MWIIESGTKQENSNKKNNGAVVRGKGNHGGTLLTVNYNKKNKFNFSNTTPVILIETINAGESNPSEDLYTINLPNNNDNSNLMVDKIEINGEVYTKSSVRIKDGEGNTNPIAYQFIYDEVTKKIIIRIPSGNRKQILDSNTSVKIIAQKQNGLIGNQNLPINLFPEIFQNLPLIGDFSWTLNWESDPSASLNLICDWTAIDKIRLSFTRGTEYTILGIGFRVSDYTEEEGNFGEIKGGLFLISISLEGFWNFFKEKESYVRNDNNDNSDKLTSGVTSAQLLGKKVGVNINAPNCPVYYNADTGTEETLSWDSTLQEFSRIFGSFIDYNSSSSVNLVELNNVNHWDYSTNLNQLFPVSENESIRIFISNNYKDKANSPKKEPVIPSILRNLIADRLKSDTENQPSLMIKDENTTNISYENTGVTHVKLEWDKGNPIDGNYLELKDNGSDIALDIDSSNLSNDDINNWNNNDFTKKNYDISLDNPDEGRNELENSNNPLNILPPDMSNDKTGHEYRANEPDESNEPNLFPLPRWVKTQSKELIIEDGDTENLGSPPPNVKKINVDALWTKSGVTKVHSIKKTLDGLPVEDEINTYGYYGTASESLQQTVSWGQVKHEKTIHLYDRNMYIGYNTYGWQLIQLSSENTKDPETLKLNEKMAGLNSSTPEYQKLNKKLQTYKFVSVPIVVKNRKMLGQYSDYYPDIKDKEFPPYELYKVCQRNGLSNTIAVVQPEYYPSMFEFSDQTKRDSFYFVPNPDYIPPKPKQGGGMTEPQGAEFLTTGEDSFLRKKLQPLPAKITGFKQKIQSGIVVSENIYEGKDMVSTVDIKFSASGANFNDAAEETSIHVSEGRPPSATGFPNNYRLEWVEPNKKKETTKKETVKESKPRIVIMDSSCGIQPDQLRSNTSILPVTNATAPTNPPVYIPPKDSTGLIENTPVVIDDTTKTTEEIVYEPNIGINPNDNPPSKNDRGEDLDYYFITPPHTFDEPVNNTISYQKAKNFAEAFKAMLTDAIINDVKNTLSTSIKIPLNLSLRPGDKITVNTATTRYHRRIISINGTIKFEGLIDNILVASWQPMTLSLGIDRVIPLNYIKKSKPKQSFDNTNNDNTNENINTEEQIQDPVIVTWVHSRDLVLGETLNYTTCRIFG